MYWRPANRDCCLRQPHRQTLPTSSQVEAKYVANWATSFFQINDGTTTEFPLGGGVQIDSNNRFRLQIPDLTCADHPATIRIWVRDEVTHQIVDQLGPSANTRLGDISLESLHAGPGTLNLSPANDSCARDAFGFAIHTGINNTCDR